MFEHIQQLRTFAIDVQRVGRKHAYSVSNDAGLTVLKSEAIYRTPRAAHGAALGLLAYITSQKQQVTF